jgi:hypothetical protein
MADFAAIAAVGKSIAGVLNAAFAAHEPVTTGHTRAVLVTTADFAATRAKDRIGPFAVSIFLYRAGKTAHAAWTSDGTPEGNLALDLHYLLTPWADDAENEHRILGRAIQAIEATPVLSGPILDPSAHWDPGETVQLAMEEVPTEVVTGIFASLPMDFRLSVACVARIARLDTRVSP